MSRIGIKPITIPAGVEVSVEDGNVVKVKGPKGELSAKVGSGMKVTIEDGTLRVARADDGRENRSQHGLARTLIDNMLRELTTAEKTDRSTVWQELSSTTWSRELHRDLRRSCRS